MTTGRKVGIAVTVCAAFICGLLARPALHLVNAMRLDRDDRTSTPAGHVNDASHLNRTRVDVWDVPPDAAQAERQLARLLNRARDEKRKVSIAGARHSMGGHTIYPGGVSINMLPFRSMRLDDDAGVLHVGAGARWSQIIPWLDERGWTVAVMQSNNSFTVGGSISVNCHGWQFDSPPIASTVRSLRLMQADGRVVRCSRTENRELFSLVLGGYGLFGVILDVELRVVRNRRYRSKQVVVPVDDSLATFDETIRRHPNVEMVYARLNIAPDALFEDVVLNVFYPDAAETTPPALCEPKFSPFKRAVFRGSAGSEYGKRLRWFAETRVQPLLAPRYVSRNQLLNEGVELFGNHSNATTDILHEYFVPRESIAAFLDEVRKIVTEYEGDLLNVTVRSVNADRDTFLSYADRHVFALVMLFHQRRTQDAESRMQSMTRAMIDAAIARGGRYYLPYRLHATPEQFHRGYPQGRRFFQLKRKYDPDELFQNRFYVKYGRT